MDTLQIAHDIVNALDDKKAEDIILLDIRSVFPFADYFVICSASSGRMVNALVRAVVDKIHPVYHLPTRVEGRPEDGWMLVDFGDVVLHVFSPDQRSFYDLEDLWREAKVILRVQ